MLPKKLKVHGYRSYVDAEIDFQELGSIVAITGVNGAGKSSLIEMLTTVLFWRNQCTDSSGAGMDECINNNCDYMELILDFEMNGIHYTIATKKEREKSRTLQLLIDGIDQSEKVTETQAKINSILKLSYDTFLDTICIGQGMSGNFMSKTAAERKDVFAQILDVKKIDLYEKEAKERKKTIKTKIDVIEQQLNNINDFDLNQDNLDQAILVNQDLIKTYNVDLITVEAELEKVLEEKARYNELVERTALIFSTRAKLKNRIDQIQTQIDTLQEKINNISVESEDGLDIESEQLNTKIEDLKSQLISLRDEKTNLTAQNEFYLQEINSIKEKYNKLKNYNESVCELCMSTITVEHKEKHLSAFMQQAKERKQKIEDNNIKINELSVKIQDGINSGKQFSERIKEINNIKHNNELLLSNKKLWEETIQDKLNDLHSIEKEYEENIKINVTQPEEKIFNDNELKSKLVIIRNNLLAAEKEITYYEMQIAQLKKNQEQITQLKQQLKALKEEYSDINAVCTLFGKSGIKSKIIAHDLPQIEAEINNVISVLSDGQLSINFITQTTVGKGKTKHTAETLDIIINDISGSRPYETYSGGEKFRVDFACHVGLAKFLTKRAGSSMDFFIIDEGLGSQDDNARQKFVESIYQLSKFFKQIFCITHINELKDAFESRVLIEKDVLTGSKISIIA